MSAALRYRSQPNWAPAFAGEQGRKKSLRTAPAKSSPGGGGGPSAGWWRGIASRDVPNPSHPRHPSVRPAACHLPLQGRIGKRASRIPPRVPAQAGTQGGATQPLLAQAALGSRFRGSTGKGEIANAHPPRHVDTHTRRHHATPRRCAAPWATIGRHHASLSRYQRTVFSIPLSNVSCGRQPSSRSIRVASIA